MPVFRFGAFALDTHKRELRLDGAPRHVEPQVFDVLRYLVENCDRAVSREELVDAVWPDRFISESTLSSRISFARRAVNDDGKRQYALRTLPKRGFRFVAEVKIDRDAARTMAKSATAESDRTAPSASQDVDAPVDPAQISPQFSNSSDIEIAMSGNRRASICVLPIRNVGVDTTIANGLTRDITLGLARHRSLFVISSATAFATLDRGHDIVSAAHAVGSDYGVTGHIAGNGLNIDFTIELFLTQHGGIIWTEHYSVPSERIHELSPEIAAEITAFLISEVEVVECRRSALKTNESLNAWEAHHKGLRHLHRFTSHDNDIAQSMFERAIGLDPTFSRPYAALSYCHWMNAFAFRPADSSHERENAYRAASRGMESDPKDPAVLWSLSRALWMNEDETAALKAVEQAIELSPSFALAHHSRSFVDCQTGDPDRAIVSSRMAQRLSPFDPWRYAMDGVEAFSYVRLGRYHEASNAARRLISRPNAHVQARGLAVVMLALSGNDEEASSEVSTIRELMPEYRIEHFFSAYHVSDALRQKILGAAARIGLS